MNEEREKQKQEAEEQKELRRGKADRKAAPKRNKRMSSDLSASRRVSRYGTDSIDDSDALDSMHHDIHRCSQCMLLATPRFLCMWPCEHLLCADCMSDLNGPRCKSCLAADEQALSVAISRLADGVAEACRVSVERHNEDVLFTLLDRWKTLAGEQGLTDLVNRQITPRGADEGTLLSGAVIAGTASMVTMLLTAGASAADSQLHVACRLGNAGIVEQLLKFSSVESRAEKGETPLHIAAKFNRLKVAKVLCKSGANVDACDNQSRTPLHWSGSLRILLWLLDQGASINSQSLQGFTPLHHAAAHGDVDIVAALLDRNAHPSMRDFHGRTPLHVAAGAGHEDVVLLLLSHSADVNAVDLRGWTPLHHCCNRPSPPSNVEVASALIDAGSDVQAETERGWRPMMLAARHRDHETVSMLLLHGGVVRDFRPLSLNGWDHSRPKHEARRSGTAMSSRHSQRPTTPFAKWEEEKNARMRPHTALGVPRTLSALQIQGKSMNPWPRPGTSMGVRM